uniref:RING-type domain-containing protein n=1 Tax=Oryza punctata TaxID=4537 RepID=A0A0E0L7P7_ORYPU
MASSSPSFAMDDEDDDFGQPLLLSPRDDGDDDDVGGAYLRDMAAISESLDGDMAAITESLDREMTAITEILDQARSYSFTDLPQSDDPPPPAVNDNNIAGLMMKTVDAPGDGGDCPICLSGGGGGGETWKETACGHRFHARCVERWARSKGSCPMCRREMLSPAELLMRDIRALYGDEELQFMVNGDMSELLEDGLYGEDVFGSTY